MIKNWGHSLTEDGKLRSLFTEDGKLRSLSYWRWKTEVTLSRTMENWGHWGCFNWMAAGLENRGELSVIMFGLNMDHNNLPCFWCSLFAPLSGMLFGLTPYFSNVQLVSTKSPCSLYYALTPVLYCKPRPPSPECCLHAMDTLVLYGSAGAKTSCSLSVKNWCRNFGVKIVHLQQVLKCWPKESEFTGNGGIWNNSTKQYLSHLQNGHIQIQMP